MSEDSFYFLRHDLFQPLELLEVVGHTELSATFNWVDGVAFDRPFPKETFALDSSSGTRFPAFFDTTVPLMSSGLVTALRALGAPLEAYPVVLEHPTNGIRSEDYSAVNLVGRVDAVDLSRSPHTLRFRKPKFSGAIHVDPVRASGQRFFRFPHSPRFMVVNAEVAASLAAQSWYGLLLQPTTAYTGT